MSGCVSTRPYFYVTASLSVGTAEIVCPPCRLSHRVCGRALFLWNLFTAELQMVTVTCWLEISVLTLSVRRTDGRICDLLYIQRILLQDSNRLWHTATQRLKHCRFLSDVTSSQCYLYSTTHSQWQFKVLYISFKLISLMESNQNYLM